MSDTQPLLMRQKRILRLRSSGHGYSTLSVIGMILLAGIACAALGVGLGYGLSNRSRVNVAATELRSLETNVTDAETMMDMTKIDVTTLQGNLSTTQGDVTTLQGDLSTTQGDVTTLQNQIAVLETMLSELGNQNVTFDNTVADELEVWINAGTGDDNNEGTEVSPLATLDAAVDKLSTTLGGANLCTIHIRGTLDLGTDPVVCTFPLQRQCKHLIIKGGEYTALSSTVQSLGAIEPNGQNWERVTAADSGFGTSTYQNQFIRNNEQNRVYMIDDNTDTTLDVIITETDFATGTFPSIPTPASKVSISPFSGGDSFTTFTISDGITWTGSLVMDVPFNDVIFSQLVVTPATSASIMQLPDVGVPRVQLVACRIVVSSSSFNSGAISGSYVLKGVHITPNVPGATRYFQSYQSSKFRLMESVTVDSTVNFAFQGGNEYYALGLQMKNARLIAAIEKMVLAGVLFKDATFISIQLNSGSSTFSANKIASQSPTSTFSFIEAQDSVEVYMRDFIINNPSAGSVFSLTSHSRVYLEGRMTITGGTRIALVTQGASLIINPTAFSNVFTVTNGPAFSVTQGDLYFGGTAGASTIDLSALAVPVVQLTQGNLFLSRVQTWSTSAGVPLIEANGGSQAFRTVALTNNGAGDVINCGTNPDVAWSTTISDASDNVFCTTI